MSTYFSAKELLSPPAERPAFSDRQAYVCAELSKLAYFKFEGGHALDQVLELAREFVGDDERFALLEDRIRSVLSDSSNAETASTEVFTEILAAAGFSLVETYNASGTAAFLATRKVTRDEGAEKTIAYLVFRGTEPKDFRDIKTDVSAKLTKVELDGSVLEVHSGYWAAFGVVRRRIQKTLEETNFDQLIVTGHSLGGALAVVTTRVLASSAKGACYTFGAPPVGTADFQNMLKTPVYQIINEVDIVPRLPNPFLMAIFRGFIKVLRFVLKTFTVTARWLSMTTLDDKLEAFVVKLSGYRHPGYVSYLVGAGAAAHLRYNVSAYDRLKWWSKLMFKRASWSQRKKILTDHGIDQYVRKLTAHARSRNP